MSTHKEQFFLEMPIGYYNRQVLTFIISVVTTSNINSVKVVTLI